MAGIFPNQSEHFQERFVDHFLEVLGDMKLFFSVWKNLHLPEALTDLALLCEEYDFVFFHTLEPLQVSRTIVANQVLEDFKYRDRIIFVCSDQSDTVISEYHQWCKENNFAPLKIFLYNFISSYPSYSYMEEADILESLVKPKSRHYVSLNCTFRWHRLKLISDLYTEKLNHLGHISLGPGDRIGAWHSGSEEFIKVTGDPSVTEWYAQEKNNLPYRLDNFSDDPKNKFATGKGLLPFVQDACFSITSETWFGCRPHKADELSDFEVNTFQNEPFILRTNCMASTVYATEKCFKNFSSGIPFVVLGKPNTVAFLEKMGFNMYSDWIDHSYDAVEDNQLRYNMLLEEVQRLCSISLEDWQIMLSEMSDVIIANYRRWAYTSDPVSYTPISPPELLREYVDNL